MTEPSGFIAPFTAAEQRQAEFIVKENAMLGTGQNNPNYPFRSAADAERERQDEELYADAMLLMEAARRITDLQEFLASLTPVSNGGVDATAVARAFAEEFHSSVEEDCRKISPEAVRDWCKAQVNRGPARLFEQIDGMARR